jgi:DNA-binding FadR family transcriptional regulator
MELLDVKSLSVLRIISGNANPIGSWNLVELLKEEGISVSSATVGRILNRLEKQGYVRGEKFRGRSITRRGHTAIKQTLEVQERELYKQELEEILDRTVLQDFLMIVEARTAIEITTARLAAERIGDEEVNEIARILETQAARQRQGKSIAKEDIEFHTAIARASKNRMLELLYAIIARGGQQSEMFEQIRKKINSPYVLAHQKIFEALRNRDPAAAERTMAEHMTHLNEDINSYWTLTDPDG